MKLTKEQEKVLEGLSPEVQELVKGDSWRGENRYTRHTDVGGLRPFLNYFNEKEIPHVDKSVDGCVIIEADLSKVPFDEKVFIFTELKDVVEETTDAPAEDAGKHTTDK